MAFALNVKKIHCNNCGYEGKAKLQSKGAGGAFGLIILLIVGFFFWPAFIAAFGVLVFLVVRPADQVCPKCKFANPIPLAHYKNNVVS
ncbi:MAG: hypothetical protein GY841_12390 [FCB group bacterium]|nr:hypothetical protein [FCB group bacterium]